MAEAEAIDRFIYAQLAADSALSAVVSARIYADVAPDTADFPYVVFTFLTGNDLMVINGTRVWADTTYLIKGVDEAGSYMNDLKIIAGRIDAVLHKSSGTNVDGEVYTLTREQPFRMTEADQGRIFKHSGGIYRIRAI